MVVQVRLSISRELAKLLEGKITVTSSLNHGATFSLVLPLAIQPEMELSNSLPIQPRQYIPIDKMKPLF
jgi:K+-sensing histidine kinase KdpD